MHIDSVNSVSSLNSKKAVAGDSLSLPEDGAGQEDFANALSGQKKLLREAKGQPEELGQPQATDKLQEVDDPQKKTDDQDELVALLGKYLPAPDENGNADDIGGALLTVPDPPNASVQIVAPETTAKDISGAMALTGLTFIKPIPEEAKLNPPIETATSGDFLQKSGFFRRSAQEGQGLDLVVMENIETTKEAPALEKQSFLSGLDKAMPGVTTDMLPAHRLVDSRADIQAITRPVTHPNWGKDLGEQIMWMHNKDISVAEIRLNPDHLGPISVRIDVNQDQQATIMFTAQHLEAKEAIEASIPKLREMLVSQQVNLVNVNISQNSTPNQGRSQPNPFRTMPENNEHGLDDITSMENSGLGQAVVGKGLLSLYA